jgi:hypothetical protein
VSVLLKTLHNVMTKYAGYLLDLATVVNSVGVTVQEANIQGDQEHGPCCVLAEEHDFAKDGRIFRFLLSKSGGKLVSANQL